VTFGEFGSWDDYRAEADGLDTFFFLATVIVMMVIMFNLIVAIFTDTYDEMKENERAIELKMLNEVIRELENWHRFWRGLVYGRPANEPSHLVYVEYELRPYVNWGGKVQATHKTIGNSL
jgi:hypothetical protein